MAYAFRDQLETYRLQHPVRVSNELDDITVVQPDEWSANETNYKAWIMKLDITVKSERDV